MSLTELQPADADEARQADDARQVYEMIAGQWVSSTVRAAAELGVVDVLLGGPSSAEDVASAVGGDPSGIRRLLVVCTSLGLLEEDADGRFGPTPKGALLADSRPGSLRALARLQGAPGVWQLWGALPEAVRRGSSQARALLGQDYFGYLADHPDEGRLFAGAMRDLTGLVVEDACRIVDLGAARDVLDVGGGNGSFLLALLAANPSARGRVLDRPQVVDLARQTPAAAELGMRFEAVAGDFLEHVPSADYYVLKLVLHDWDDERCTQILANCRSSAHASSRLLVVEALIGEAAAPGDALDVGAMMDMTILSLVAGRERRLSEYTALLAAAGWRVEQVQATRSSYSLIEAVPS